MTNGVYLHQVCGEVADSAAEAFYHLAICPFTRRPPVERAAIDLDEDSRRRLVHHRQRVEREAELAAAVRRRA